MRENQPRDHLSDLCGFGCRFFQKLETHRRIVKQLARHNGRPLRTGCFRDALDLSTLVDRARSRFLVDAARRYRQFGYRRDGGQRLAAEAQRVQSEQIVRFCDFACRMAFKGHTNVAGADSASVIRDAQIGNAAVADFHGDACCACV